MRIYNESLSQVYVQLPGRLRFFFSIPVVITDRIYNSAQVRRKQRHFTTINIRTSASSNGINISTNTKCVNRLSLHYF